VPAAKAVATVAAKVEEPEAAEVKLAVAVAMVRAA